ncbi:MAG: hypothetical protein Q9172_001484 [Xanthocarpia lactea]
MSPGSNALDPSIAEQLVDTLFEIGRDQLTKQRYKSALQWLDRAHDTLANQNPEDLSFDASEVRSCIMHTTIRVLLKDRGEESISRAWKICHELEGETKNKIVVWLLQLQLLGVDQSAAQNYYEVLDQVVRQVHLSDANLATILHHAHELRRQNARLAHAVLTVLLSERLLVMDETTWVGKTLVMIVWNCSTSPDLGAMTDALEELLDKVVAKTDSGLSTSATHAAQILMLKRIEALYGHADYDQADAWCRLALHDAFSSSGNSNFGKLQRKRLLCALGKSDLARCRDIRCQMSESTERDPSTQYLLYKVALKCRDTDLGRPLLDQQPGSLVAYRETDIVRAAECLSSISREPGKDSTLLYACVLEAQKNGDRLQVIRALSQVLDNTTYQVAPGLQLPALLRLLARMLIQELENGQSQDRHCMVELCKVFEGAAAAAKRSRRDFGKDDLFPSAELDWFCRNSYNVALKVCTVWEADTTLRVVQACLNLQYYLTLRKTAGDFRTLVKQQLPSLAGGAKLDLMRKYSCLLAFDFEAAARLKAWASLEDIISVCITLYAR